MTKRVRVYVSAGFNVSVVKYGMEETCLRHIEGGSHGHAPIPGVTKATVAIFRQGLQKFRRGKFWFSHETDLLRLCLLFQRGGV